MCLRGHWTNPIFGCVFRFVGGGFLGVFVVYERVAERDEVFVGGERVFKASPLPAYASASALSAPFLSVNVGKTVVRPLKVSAVRCG